MRPAAASRRGVGYRAFLAHRISGLALAVFLPLHFLTLGLALEGAEALDRFLAFADLPLVKADRMGSGGAPRSAPGARSAAAGAGARSVARHAHRVDRMGGWGGGHHRTRVSGGCVTCASNDTAPTS